MCSNAFFFFNLCQDKSGVLEQKQTSEPIELNNQAMSSMSFSIVALPPPFYCIVR